MCLFLRFNKSSHVNLLWELPSSSGWYSRHGAFVLHDLHGAVHGTFVLVSFQSLLKTRPHDGDDRQRGGALRGRGKNHYRPAFWSLWHPEECFRTRWRRRRPLRTTRSAWGWWFCWDRLLQSRNNRRVGGRSLTAEAAGAALPLYQFLRDVMT